MNVHAWSCRPRWSVGLQPLQTPTLHSVHLWFFVVQYLVPENSLKMFPVEMGLALTTSAGRLCVGQHSRKTLLSIVRQGVYLFIF